MKQKGNLDIVQSGGIKKYKHISELTRLKREANDKLNIVEGNNGFPVILHKNEEINVIQNNGKYGLVNKNGHMGYIKMENLVPIDENDDSSTALLKAQKLWKKNQEKKQSEKERHHNSPITEENNIIRTLKQQLKNEESKGTTILRNKIRSELLLHNKPVNTYPRQPPVLQNSLSYLRPPIFPRENSVSSYVEAGHGPRIQLEEENWRSMKPTAKATHFPPRRAVGIKHKESNWWLNIKNL